MDPARISHQIGPMCEARSRICAQAGCETSRIAPIITPRLGELADTMQRRLVGVLALLLMLVAAGPLAAQDSDTEGVPPLSAEELERLDARASELLGIEVNSPNGEKLGKIEDLILDVANSQVRYAVVAYGGALGYGTRMAAFPPVLFRPGRKEGQLVLYVTPEQFRNAPSFEASAWPDWLEARYPDQVDRFFFLKDDTVVDESSGSQLVRADDVIGRDVNDGGSRAAGSIEDVVVNLGNGQIRYVVLDYSTRLGLTGKLVPLPLVAFHFPSRPDVNAFLTLDRERVAAARAFDSDDWPDLGDARSRKEIEDALSQLGEQGPERASGGGETKSKGEAE